MIDAYSPASLLCRPGKLAHTPHSSPEASAQFLNACAAKWHQEIELLYEGLATGQSPGGAAAGRPNHPRPAHHTGRRVGGNERCRP